MVSIFSFPLQVQFERKVLFCPTILSINPLSQLDATDLQKMNLGDLDTAFDNFLASRQKQQQQKNLPFLYFLYKYHM